MTSFCVQNMSEMGRKLNKYLFTDNISKLGCVIQQSQATHMLHECKTDKHDSVTSYIIHHTNLCVPLYKCTHMCDSFIRALYACWKLQAYWLILWNQEIEHLWVVQWQSINFFFASFFFSQLRGMYMTRQLSFAGVTFDIKELPLAKDFIEMYDASVKLVSYVLHSNLSVIFCIQITQATVHCLCYLNFFGNFCILIFDKIPSITKITCFIDYKLWFS